MAKKILVVSEKSQDPTAIHKSFVDGFISNGCKTELFLSPTYPALIQKLSGKLSFVKSILQKQTGNLLRKQANLSSFDAIFILKGSFIDAESIKDIKSQFTHLKILCFNPDSPFNKRVSPNSCREIIPFCDTFFFWSEAGLQNILNSGAKKAVHLPFAKDSRLIYPIVSPEGFKYDVSFIGNGDKERKVQLKLYAAAMVRSAPDINIDIFGAKWNTSNFNVNVHVHGAQNGNNFLKTIGQSRININLLRLQNKNSTNMRTFEIPGAGGFMLHEASEEAQSIFLPDKEAAYFSNSEEFVDKIKFYIKKETSRQQIAQAGYQKTCLYDCSYQQRAATIINTI